MPVGTLSGVQAAAELLCRHRLRGGLIIIIGDFDADGATSTALLVRALRSWGFAGGGLPGAQPLRVRLRTHPGDRRARGRRARPALIVTVDNGIASHAGVAAARAAGIEVLITDHHLPAGDAAGGQRDRQSQPAGQRLCAAARSPASAWRSTWPRRCAGCSRSARCSPPAALPAAELLDLVALGTVADVVPFDMNNRILVAQGLRAHPRRALRAGHHARCSRWRGARRARWSPRIWGSRSHRVSMPPAA